jgi:hypothetical protein
MSAAIQFTVSPKSENCPCTITKSPSVTIVPGSHKYHKRTAFDLPLPFSATQTGIECRTGGANGDHQIVVNFPTAVTVRNARVTFGTGIVSGYSVSDKSLLVNLTGVANAQKVTVTLTDVSDGTHVGDVAVQMGVLLGDTNGDRIVNSSDIAQTQSQSGHPVSASNFREDVTVNGVINNSDVSLVQSKSGTGF